MKTLKSCDDCKNLIVPGNSNYGCYFRRMNIMEDDKSPCLNYIDINEETT